MPLAVFLTLGEAGLTYKSWISITWAWREFQFFIGCLVKLSSLHSRGISFLDEYFIRQALCKVTLSALRELACTNSSLRVSEISENNAASDRLTMQHCWQLRRSWVVPKVDVNFNQSHACPPPLYRQLSPLRPNWLKSIWLPSWKAIVNQHPPVRHPLDACYYSVMDEPQMS
jgi:hypothetical protein